MEEQRRNPRYPCAGVAEIRLSPAASVISARILNLSLEGCLIALRLPEALPKQLKVELMFSVNGLPFRVWGRLNCVRANHSLGFQFTHVSDRIVRQLQELMEELAAERQKSKSRLKLVKKPNA
jgi:hypothetical protein